MTTCTSIISDDTCATTIITITIIVATVAIGAVAPTLPARAFPYAGVLAYIAIHPVQ